MDESGRLALGIDIGGTTTKIALVDAAGHVRDMGTAETLVAGDPRQFIARLIAYTRTLLDPQIRSVGVAVAGFLDHRRDRLVYNPNLAALEQFPLQQTLADSFGLPVMLEVDSNAACLAEYRFGAGRGSRRFLTLTAGTGLGGGMVIDGEILRFAYECLGDVGHVIVAPGGPLCSCGGRGCAEVMVCGRGRDPEALADAGRYLGIALASLTAIFFPDRIAIGGGVAEAGEVLLAPARESFRAIAGRLAQDRVEIVAGELGAKATVIGAAIVGQ
jgi:glucokinase